MCRPSLLLRLILLYVSPRGLLWRGAAVVLACAGCNERVPSHPPTAPVIITDLRARDASVTIPEVILERDRASGSDAGKSLRLHPCGGSGASTLRLVLGKNLGSCPEPPDGRLAAVTEETEYEQLGATIHDAFLGRKGKVLLERMEGGRCHVKLRVEITEVRARLDHDLWVEADGRVSGRLSYVDPGIPATCGHGFTLTGHRSASE